MDWLAIGNHLLNFSAPACFVGWLLAFASLFCAPIGVGAKAVGRWQRAWQAGWINSIAASLASTAALVVWGRDGEMAGYGVLVLAAATSHWWVMRGWRR